MATAKSTPVSNSEEIDRIVPHATPEVVQALTVGVKDASTELTSRFLALTGFKAEEVIGSNSARRTFSTTGGGKYQVTKNGKAVRVILGPNYPKGIEEAEEADEE